MEKKDRYTLSLEVQRFISNRWKTKKGEKVIQQIIDRDKKSTSVKDILYEHILNHYENIEPYEFPIYPASQICKNEFWVLTEYDLCGVLFVNTDFSNINLNGMMLLYSNFYNCNFSNAEIARANLSHAIFNECIMNKISFFRTGGFCTDIKKCNLKHADLQESHFINCNFSESIFEEVYFEKSLLEDIEVNYQTKFDLNIVQNYEKRTMPSEQVPDIIRAIRISYEKSELWSQMDVYFYKEKEAQRKYLLWPAFRNEKNIKNFWAWFKSFMDGMTFGYSTKPFRIILINFIIALLFSLIYLINPIQATHKLISMDSFLEALYFSLTTFATLGYGDLSYNAAQPIMRIICTLEAWVGAVSISLFVVVFARKVFR